MGASYSTLCVFKPTPKNGKKDYCKYLAVCGNNSCVNCPELEIKKVEDSNGG